MAPPRKPLIDLETPGAVGTKTTSLRMQGAQWEQMDIFARAMGLSANEFVGRAVDAYIRHVSKREDVQKAVRKQINQQKALLDYMMKLTGVSPGDAAEDDESEEEEATEEFEEVDDDEDDD